MLVSWILVCDAMLTKTEDSVSASWHLWQVMSVTTNCYAWHVTPGDDRSQPGLWLVRASPHEPLIGQGLCCDISLGTIRCHLRRGAMRRRNWELGERGTCYSDQKVSSHRAMCWSPHPPGLTLVTNQVTRWRIHISKALDNKQLFRDTNYSGRIDCINLFETCKSSLILSQSNLWEDN